jgi:hypothetical protein
MQFGPERGHPWLRHAEVVEWQAKAVSWGYCERMTRVGGKVTKKKKK